MTNSRRRSVDRAQRKTTVKQSHKLLWQRRCKLLNISRSASYGASQEIKDDLHLMLASDEKN